MPSPTSSPPVTIERSQKGLFKNGSWYCNCSPRLLAVVKTVTASTKNQGRNFYVCPIGRNEGNRCDFYLWREDAQEREKQAFHSNNRSEAQQKPMRQMTIHERITPRTEKRRWEDTTPITKLSEMPFTMAGSSRSAAAAAPDEPTSAPTNTAKSSATLQSSTAPVRSNPKADDHVYEVSSDEDEVIESPSVQRSTMRQSRGPAAPTAPATPSAGSKRKRPDVNYDDLLGDLSSDVEEELIAVTDKSVRHRDAFKTPGAERTVDVDNGMPTPAATNGKSVRRVLFADEEAAGGANGEPGSHKRQRLENGQTDTPSRTPFQAQTNNNTSTAATPAKASTSSASSAPATTPGSGSNHMTEEVMGLLKAENVSAGTLSAVRTTLNKYSAQMRGLEQGRKAVRATLEASQAREASLQAKVKNLEEARKMQRSGLMNLWQSS